jgi:hypothetical protein
MNLKISQLPPIGQALDVNNVLVNDVDINADLIAYVDSSEGVTVQMTIAEFIQVIADNGGGDTNITEIDITLNANGVDVAYVVPGAPSALVAVFINGLREDPSNYAYTAPNLIFSTPPPPTANVVAWEEA